MSGRLGRPVRSSWSSWYLSCSLEVASERVSRPFSMMTTAWRTSSATMRTVPMKNSAVPTTMGSLTRASTTHSTSTSATGM